MGRWNALAVSVVVLTVFTAGVWIGRHWFFPVAGLWAVVEYCNRTIDVVCHLELWWRVHWRAYYSPWCYRGPLIALAGGADIPGRKFISASAPTADIPAGDPTVLDRSTLIPAG
jgi:hypothetical protein